MTANEFPVGAERLTIVKFSYCDFDGRIHHDGEIMVMTAVAAQVQAIFDTLFVRRFPIAKAVLIEHYGGNDEASMEDNNTSGFNRRFIKDGERLSLHAYGLAIDINPVQNPYIHIDECGGLHIHPAAGKAYMRRLTDNTFHDKPRGMAEEVADIFAYHGFGIWGGDWRQPIDYQHFQVHRSLAEAMAQSTPPQAKILFDESIAAYRSCLNAYQGPAALARPTCVQASYMAIDCKQLNQFEQAQNVSPDVLKEK